ncbi:DNA cytosine methyltransferase [Cronobacter sakazakii]|uniref:DNA cytosine methyltransferase n=1 Tax=Cronobacter sakazakii TaxID=28141 RepID=UPI0018F87CA9|nr:DNA (cytosine-5-)-methyltransferase [Cronobacter sakazakii]ELY6342382.1 DNA (cytosine-5-)-methyltransferase [Cronobacter sakazakii]
MLIKVVDLFCGAGGLTHGLQQAGLNVVAGYDIDATCRYAYEKNNNALFVQKSVTDIEEGEINKHFKNASVKVLAGCAPCQPFSSYTNTDRSEKKTKDHRWPLLYSFAKQIQLSAPDIVTMENVPRVINHKVFKDFVDSLKSEGYSVWYDTVFCPDYGMAQSRSRLVLLASKLGAIELIPPTHQKNNYKTVRDVIGQLAPIEAGAVDKKDRLHYSSSLSPLNMERIKHSKPGGTWKDWPESLRASCHIKESGSSYTAVYGRMSWDKLGSTITTQCIGFGNGRFGHPEQNRAISLREAALLQSFPMNYEFWPEDIKVEIRNVARLIGNAVPVRLGEVVGISILEHLKKL